MSEIIVTVCAICEHEHELVVLDKVKETKTTGYIVYLCPNTGETFWRDNSFSVESVADDH